MTTYATTTVEAWAISNQAREALVRSELFRDLGAEQLQEVAALVEEIELQPDEQMIAEGDAAKYLYIVVEGRGVAQLDMYRGWLSLGLIGPNDVAGWSSLMNSQVYPAAVKALTPMRIARIEAKGLTLLMNLDSSIGYPVTRRLANVFCRQYHAALEAFKTSS